MRRREFITLLSGRGVADAARGLTVHCWDAGSPYLNSS